MHNINSFEYRYCIGVMMIMMQMLNGNSIQFNDCRLFI